MNDKTRDFIGQHIDDDVRQLALRGCRDEDVDLDMALRQIAGQQTARRKLPSWAALDGILYPPHLNMEQCSSEQTARYKASICQRLLASLPTPHTLADLTGGFGVDFTILCDLFNQGTYVEKDSALFAISSHNIRTFGKNTEHMNDDGMDYLHRMEHSSMIFMDPARRDDHGGRTYGISDCTPNVLEVKDELLQKADVVMLKLSPMLDWHKAVSDLGEQHIKEVHIVSVQNECKELLIVMQKEAGQLTVYCVNDDSVFAYHPSANSSCPVSFQSSPVYLYEPNAAIMKAGCFREVSSTFKVQPLAANSHLFTSTAFVEDFPGRKFMIHAISSMNKQELKTALKDIRRANITVRNFPMTVAELRKKLKLSEGGNDYIFATTLAEGKKVLILCQHL